MKKLLALVLVLALTLPMMAVLADSYEIAWSPTLETSMTNPLTRLPGKA